MIHLFASKAMFEISNSETYVCNTVNLSLKIGGKTLPNCKSKLLLLIFQTLVYYVSLRFEFHSVVSITVSA